MTKVLILSDGSILHIATASLLTQDVKQTARIAFAAQLAHGRLYLVVMRHPGFSGI